MAVKKHTNKVEWSCSCIIFPVSWMRTDSAFSLTFPGRVKLTEIKSRLTEGVNFKEEQLKCISFGASCLFKIKMLSSKGAGRVFREQSTLYWIKALLRLNMSAEKVEVMWLVKRYVKMGFPECPYTHSPEGNPKQAHRLSLAPSGLGAMRAEFGENTPGSGRLLPPQSPCSPDPADRPCPAGWHYCERTWGGSNTSLMELASSRPGQRCRCRRPLRPVHRLASAAPALPAVPASPHPSLSRVCLKVWLLPFLFYSLGIRSAGARTPCLVTPLHPALPRACLWGRRWTGLCLGAVSPPVIPVRPIPHAFSNPLPLCYLSAWRDAPQAAWRQEGPWAGEKQWLLVQPRGCAARGHVPGHWWLSLDMSCDKFEVPSCVGVDMCQPQGLSQQYLHIRTLLTWVICIWALFLAEKQYMDLIKKQ